MLDKLFSKLEKTMIQKDTCTPIFITALFTIAKTCKHPKCPLTEEWIKKMWCIQTIGYYSAEWNNAVCSNMDEPGETILITYRQSLKKFTKNLFIKQKQTQRHRKQTYSYQGERWGGGYIWSLGLKFTLYFKQITNKDLLYSMRNSAQYSVIT